MCTHDYKQLLLSCKSGERFFMVVIPFLILRYLCLIAELRNMWSQIIPKKIDKTAIRNGQAPSRVGRN
jgi:hypothetical protein